MTTDPLIERWNDLRATLDGYRPIDIEIVRVAFYLGACATIDTAIAAPAGSVRLVLMRAELYDWYRGDERDAAA